MSYKSAVVFFWLKEHCMLMKCILNGKNVLSKVFLTHFLYDFNWLQVFFLKMKAQLGILQGSQKRICSRLRLFSCRGLCCHSSVWCFDFPLNLKDTLPWHLGALCILTRVSPSSNQNNLWMQRIFLRIIFS